MEATEVFTTYEWIRKMWYIHLYIYMCVYVYMCIYVHIYVYIHTHNRILLRHKKKEILPFEAMWVDLENIMLSEISQTEKDKY